jgi:hypothetical protein
MNRRRAATRFRRRFGQDGGNLFRRSIANTRGHSCMMNRRQRSQFRMASPTSPGRPSSAMASPTPSVLPQGKRSPVWRAWLARWPFRTRISKSFNPAAY